MKKVGSKVQFKLAARQKKILLLAAMMAIVVVFISFLLSLSEDQKTSTTPAKATGELAPTAPVQQPAAERYDYVNMLNEPEQPSTDNTATSGSLTPPVSESAPHVSDDPFAHMQPKPEPAPSTTPTSTPATENTVTTPATDSTATQAILYCDSFSSAQEAESRKAMIAFQGISSQVTHQDGKIVLAVGPFKDRQVARSTFATLADKGLVTQCSLTDLP